MAKLMIVDDNGEAMLVTDLDDWDLDKPLAREGLILEIISTLEYLEG